MKKAYYWKHREEILRENKTPEKRKHMREYMNEYYRKEKEGIFDLIGRKCVVCGSTDRINFHEIHGKDHSKNSNWQDFKYYKEHPEDFVPLCYKHHKSLHALFDLKEEQIKKFIDLLKLRMEKQQ